MNSPGLRERKKQKTRWAIQEQALRLIAEQGYEATTIDQIAAAADISPSTFFRYFRTKEDLIIQDQYDDVLVEGLRTIPVEVPPLEAIRQVIRTAIVTLSPAERAKVLERMQLTMAVPALRARSLDNFFETMNLLQRSIGARVGLDPNHVDLRIMAGAVVGALVGVFDAWAASGGTEDFGALIDHTLTQLAAGLPMGSGG